MNRSHYPSIDKLWCSCCSAEEFLHREVLDKASNTSDRERLEQELAAIEKAQCAMDFVAMHVIKVAAGTVGHGVLGVGVLPGLAVAGSLRLTGIDAVPVRSGFQVPFTLHIAPDGLNKALSILKIQCGEAYVAIHGGASQNTPCEVYLSDVPIRDIVRCDWSPGHDRSLSRWGDRVLTLPHPPPRNHGMLRIDLVPSELVAALESSARAAFPGCLKPLIRVMREIPLDDCATLDYLRSAAGGGMLRKYTNLAFEERRINSFQDFAALICQYDRTELPYYIMEPHSAAIAHQLWCLAYLETHISTPSLRSGSGCAT